MSDLAVSTRPSALAAALVAVERDGAARAAVLAEAPAVLERLSWTIAARATRRVLAEAATR